MQKINTSTWLSWDIANLFQNTLGFPKHVFPNTTKVTLLMVESCELWKLKPKLWTSQIWTLIHLINNFVCAKSSKLITLEENIISVQQLPLFLPLFFVFSSEVLNSGIKVVLTKLFIKMQFVKKCFSIHLRCLHL